MSASLVASARREAHVKSLGRTLVSARDRVGEITDRRRLLVPVDEVVQDVNRFLRA